MCLFGPPKEILTDQGSEFVNTILAALLSKLGNHRLTSAYHPRTNGATERLNQTLLNILRKFMEETITDWDILLPYIGLAYRARINTVTKYSPFELMFGLKMKRLENFITDIAEQEQTQIFI